MHRERQNGFLGLCVFSDGVCAGEEEELDEGGAAGVGCEGEGSEAFSLGPRGIRKKNEVFQRVDDRAAGREAKRRCMKLRESVRGLGRRDDTTSPNDDQSLVPKPVQKKLR